MGGGREAGVVGGTNSEAEVATPGCYERWLVMLNIAALEVRQ